jgi:hypothetical protein
MSQAGVTTGSFYTEGDNKGKFKDSNTQKIF